MNGEPDAEDDDSEDGTDGMIAPPGALQSHHEDGHQVECEVDGEAALSDAASSGLEDVTSDIEPSESEEEKELTEQVVQSEAGEQVVQSEAKAMSAEPGTGKYKAYHLSSEWLRLQALEKEKGIVVTRLPDVTGCGLGRHPAKSFWSARYPHANIKAVSWSGTPGVGRTPTESCVKCLKYVIKQHVSAAADGEDMTSWKNQLETLAKII